MATPRRFTAQRSGIALAALLVASVSVHDHRVAAMNNGVSATSDTAVEASRPARLVKIATIGSAVIHHYPG